MPLGARLRFPEHQRSCLPGYHRALSGNPVAPTAPCTACSAGHFQTFDGEPWNHVCEPCAPGRVAPSAGATACESCRKGQSTDQQHQRCSEQGLLPGLAVAPASPAPQESPPAPRRRCPKGKYSHWSNGALRLRACLNCPAGKYQTSGDTSSWWNICQLCPLGKAAPKAGASSCDPCWVLQALPTKLLQPHGIGAKACASTFAAAARRQDPVPLLLNAGGFVREILPTTKSPVQTTNMPRAPVACGTGRYGTMKLQARHANLASGTATPHWVWRVVCQACPIGRFSAARHATTCKACPKGTNAVRRGSAACAACKVPGLPGCGGNGGKAESSTEAVRCAAGKFARRVASYAACLPCPRGKYKPGARQRPWLPVSTMTRALVGCVACPTGKFTGDLNSAGGRSECNRCIPALPGRDAAASSGTALANFTMQNFGRKQMPRTCLVCASGHATLANAKKRCTPCRAGTMWVLNTEATPYRAACIPCPRGRYAPRASGTNYVASCYLCPRGQHQSSKGAIACKRCVHGKFVRFPMAPLFCYDCPPNGAECAPSPVPRNKPAQIAANTTATAVKEESAATVRALEQLLGAETTIVAPIAASAAFAADNRTSKTQPILIQQQQQQQQQGKKTNLSSDGVSTDGIFSSDNWLQDALAGLDSAAQKLVRRRRHKAVQQKSQLHVDPSDHNSHQLAQFTCAPGHYMRTETQPHFRLRAGNQGTDTNVPSLACIECSPSRYQSAVVTAHRAFACKICPLGMYQVCLRSVLSS